MEKNKIMIILLSLIILICVISGIYGYINSIKKNNEEKNYKVKIMYYLDENTKLDKIPENTEDEVLYKYDKYICTNKIKGTWNEKKWSFTPNNTADGTCKIYFISLKHKVTLNISNGTLSENTVYNVGDV